MANERGLTLLEFIIAFAILTVVISAVYITQSSSLFSSGRTKNLIFATNLARNMMSDMEVNLEGTSFESMSKEETGEFAEPYKTFSWKRTVEEVDFATLTQLLSKRLQEKNKLQGVKNEDTIMLKAFEEYLKSSVRKLTLTIEWPEGQDKSTLSFTQLLVNYDADFGTTL